jgi:seryl-tRNA synthetase
MLDLKRLRDDPEAAEAALARRGAGGEVERILQLDAHRRAAQTRADELRAEQKTLGRDVAKLQGDEKQTLLAKLSGISEEIARITAEEAALAGELKEVLLRVPNLPDASVPDGTTEDDNLVLRTIGTPRGAVPRDHLDVGVALGGIDAERGARASGTRFAYLQGPVANLWWAIARYAVEVAERNGFTFTLPPVLVRREAMEGTGFFPAAEDQIYRIGADDLYLVGTSEVPLAAFHMDEILDAAAMPSRYAAHSTCFRREAGAAGKDTRGIFRLHQFEKVEMFVFTTPEAAADEHERMIALEEEILTGLELPYRAVVLCTGDMGAPSAKTVDLEVWFPAQERYRETTSCSNTTDYQARRLNTRIKGERGNVVAHTLNGTLATSSRHVAAVLENHQQDDGSVLVPKVLQAFLGTDALRAG